MCIFSKPVHSVSATNLFARGLPDGRQHLVYEMKVAMTQPTAMVLPLPLPPGSSEDAVVFTDLSDYAEFFQHMEIGFPEVARGGPVATSMLALPQSNLRVHEVGKFIASVVPTRDDFGRLDPRFRLSDSVLDALVEQADYAFAVFQLQVPPPDAPPRSVMGRMRQWLKGSSETPTPVASPIHPMAFTFPRRDPSRLFFPTVHVHDGEVHDTARFDHALFCQQDHKPETADNLLWRSAIAYPEAFLDIERSKHLVLPEQLTWKAGLRGQLPNRDTFVG